MRRALFITLALVASMIAPSKGLAAAAPRITKAAMQDADRDDRADRVVLTYSERIKHPLDADGSYPFKVVGYGIRKIGAAQNSRTLVVFLKEKAGEDLLAHPNVSYARTTRQPVRDLAGMQAIAQTFGATIRIDRDADTYGWNDCAPTNAAINPGANDDPDLNVVDRDCDGIDGDAASSVFVSPFGDDTDTGTKAAPVETLAEALERASASGPIEDVLVARSNYDLGSGFALEDGVDVYGGYGPSTWVRTMSFDTVLFSDDVRAGNRTIGVSASVTASTRLQFLTVEARTPASPPAGLTLYGIHADGASGLVLDHVKVIAGSGAAGPSGADGTPGDPGEVGGGGLDGSCDGAAGSGGLAGESPIGNLGGAGGAGGPEGSNNGETGDPGSGGAEGGISGVGCDGGMFGICTGGDGGEGDPGADGAAGDTGVGGAEGEISLGYWAGQPGANGTDGGDGHGGGGGGGGGGQGGAVVNDGGGNGGGGGGGGGQGGGAGLGGAAGGSSFGIFAVNGPGPTVTGGSIITSGDGGAGGAGGSAGDGGAGGAGGPGAAQCLGEVGEGGEGGAGGSGGDGGPGGGGAGGLSYAVFVESPTTVTLGPTTTLSHGSGGAGGTSAGDPGSSGSSGDTNQA
jgi:hypothetical protein